MIYKVALHQSEEGFSVSCPPLHGCWSEGETEEEALENIKAAMEEYLDVLGDQFENAIVREVELAG
jgi:predicted RNase H-like HicB family nuclease